MGNGRYDPELKLVYWGVGNPGPDWNGDVRPGDNLYTCSFLALEADTGKLRWHFQFTPHDTHDWDSTHVPILFDADVGGKKRKLISIANRNAFYYVLDRGTGEFIAGRPYAKQTWAKGLDAKGQPIVAGFAAHGERQPDLAQSQRRHGLAESFLQPADGIRVRAGARDRRNVLQARAEISSTVELISGARATVIHSSSARFRFPIR